MVDVSGRMVRYLMRELDEVNVSWVYAESSCNLSDLRILAERGLITLRETETWIESTMATISQNQAL